MGRGMKLTTDLHIIARSIMVEIYLHSHTCLYGVVLKLIKHRDFTLPFTYGS
jgi:hypothetical protein